ncbi:SpoIIE family protein phosphatase [Desulfobacula sp.]|uniref:PP2C family protein-serine/threonine phosphatase n=1 Tax=Desulfobacula sp. TaxID=2593537 RepID=UPI0025C15126|nr:SpoIIE family protein phosphatase [Desulfobacula sp.]MBC2703824.1 SpoIIE family protein phosphatase [Desulfobacula sp.]
MLEGVPPGMLGVLTGLVFIIVFIVRFLIVKKVVLKSPLIDQAKKQFFSEYGLVLSAGVLMVFLDHFILSIPFVNGVVFFIGFIAFGFFIAIDMSLQKERSVIKNAMENSDVIKVPQQFYPLTRKFFIVALVTNLLVMIIIMLIIGRDLAWLGAMDPAQMNIMLGMTTKTIFKEISFVIFILLILVINILYSYSRNLKLLFQTETGILESVSNGDLSKLVPVATSDEFGVIATHTNKMIHGLRDRIRMLTRLNVAKVVQENLLPNNAPDFQNLEISGISLYCEEVGGDYFDYFKFSENKIGIALTDSSGHGVGAGLDMTTIRAYLRYGVEDYKGPAQLIASVNRHLARDSYETGRFTTVFFVEIDQGKRGIKWVRAGHEPALFFTPGSKKVQRLLGNGMALGVDADAKIDEYEICGWEKGSVLAIVSDGLKESRNSQGEMYTEKRITSTIAENVAQSAKTIEKKLLEDINAFRGDVPIADDITIVIVKFF